MTNKQLFFLAALINITMMFLLVHKQNKIINKLYNLQRLQEEKDLLLEQKKELSLTAHKLTQLSTIQNYANKELNMQSMVLKDALTIPTATPKEA